MHICKRFWTRKMRHMWQTRGGGGNVKFLSELRRHAEEEISNSAYGISFVASPGPPHLVEQDIRYDTPVFLFAWAAAGGSRFKWAPSRVLQHLRMLLGPTHSGDTGGRDTAARARGCLLKLGAKPLASTVKRTMFKLRARMPPPSKPSSSCFALIPKNNS